jgi:hypothetical protein
MAIAAADLSVANNNVIFNGDEWNWILYRHEWSIDQFLAPHNEHLVALSLLVFKTAIELFGLRSYTPFHGLLLACHFACVALVFCHLRRITPAPHALALAAPVLFLGSAWEDLLRAFQITFLLAIGFGLGALLCIGRQSLVGDVCAALMLLLAVLSSGLGLPFVVGVGCELLITSKHRRLWVCAPATVVYGLWSVTHQRDERDALEAQMNDVSLVAAVGREAARAFGALLGSGVAAGWLMAFGATAGVATLAIRSRTMPPRLVALAGTAATYWILLGALRGDRDVPDVARSRYVYLGVVLIVLAVAEIVGRYLRGPKALFAVIALAGVAVAGNRDELRLGSRILRGDSAVVGASLGALELAKAYAHASYRPDPLHAPEVRAGPYFAVTARHGSPADSASDLLNRDDAARAVADAVLVQLIRPIVRSTRVAPPGHPPQIEELRSVVAVRDGGCTRLVARQHGSSAVVVQTTRRLSFHQRDDSRFRLSLRKFSTRWTPGAAVGDAASVSSMPRLAGPRWRIKISLDGALRVCAT